MCPIFIIGIFMKLESDGILIDIRPMNERDSIARVFSRDYGVMVGMMRGAAVAKKNRPLVAQIGTVAWNARLDSQLGVFHWDATRNMAAPIMGNVSRLAMMNSAFGLICTLVPEREQNDVLYRETLKLLHALGGDADATDAYLEWEIMFLANIGYAMDLSSCAGCGTHDALVYLSPRTYRAVCENCGAQYASRLYKLPMNLGITGHIISDVCAAQGAQMPAGRVMLGKKYDAWS